MTGRKAYWPQSLSVWVKWIKRWTRMVCLSEHSPRSLTHRWVAAGQSLRDETGCRNSGPGWPAFKKYFGQLPPSTDFPTSRPTQILLFWNTPPSFEIFAFVSECTCVCVNVCAHMCTRIHTSAHTHKGHAQRCANPIFHV